MTVMISSLLAPAQRRGRCKAGVGSQNDTVCTVGLPFETHARATVPAQKQHIDPLIKMYNHGEKQCLATQGSVEFCKDLNHKVSTFVKNLTFIHKILQVFCDYV